MEANTMRAQLLELMKGIDKDKLKGLVAELKELGLGETEEEKKKRTARGSVHVTVKRKKIVTRHMTCLNCGNTWRHTLELSKGEGCSFPGVKGIYSITVEEDFTPLTVDCKVIKCEHCQTAISRWSRGELEERYMQLLCRLAIGFDVKEKTIE